MPNVRYAPGAAVAGKRMHTRAVFKQYLSQPQFQIGPIGVRVQQGPKLPPL
jgi:hypothetical protein